MANKNCSGVTLVEVLVSMVIVLVVGLACVQVLQFNSRSTLTVFKRIQAGQYLDQIHQQLQRSNIAKLDDHYRSFPQILTDSDYTADVALQKSADDGSRLATITVHWAPDPEKNVLSQDVTLVAK